MRALRIVWVPLDMYRQWSLDPAKAALILKKFDQVLESVVC